MDSAVQQLANFITVTAPDYVQYKVFSYTWVLVVVLIVGIVSAILLAKAIKVYRRETKENGPGYIGGVF